ncbi:MAG: TIGR03986 family CRISPR-associated RAMP protein [Candidatus Methylumidiphilus alinenensis]|uniref:TIGR03986 family CRISPR-associated RAMP protein n=1 Tax=Candidatus Methylumidiphilus alinenensis TaxID=2202197 RepID=A0A2W4RED6_9GAMM|nr:MAG: TIGR03986 family CRISPR-associated RAMP protein [Candidatus Methylumidiphilus alinenensis]
MSTKITNNSSANHLAKLGLGVPYGSAKPQLGLWMGCSLLDITLLLNHLNEAYKMDFYNPYHFIPVTGKVGNDWTPSVPFEQIKRGEKPKGENLGIRHDLWLKTQHSGRILCSVKLETPTVVGNQHDKEKLATGETFVDLYQDIHGDYALPANSLRGMVASVAEALSQSALRVLEKETYSVRKEVGKGLSAIGYIRTEIKCGETHYFLRPLCFPTIPKIYDERAGRFEKKWITFFNSNSLLGEWLPAYVNGYQYNREDKKVEYIRTNSFLNANISCNHFRKPNFYYARLDSRLNSFTINDNVDINNPSLYIKYNRNREGNQTYSMLGQRIIDNNIKTQIEFDGLTPTEQSSYTRGVLFVLGIEGREKEIPITKHHERFIPTPKTKRIKDKEVEIPTSIVDKFLLIAKTQHKADESLPFLPQAYCLIQNRETFLADGDMVYFDINDQGQVTEISYSSIWRKPIDRTIHEAFARIYENLVPWGYTDRKDLTPAECLFGVVEGGDKKVEKAKKANQDLPPSSKNLASRLRFSDAHSAEPEKIKTLKPMHEPEKGYQLKILSSPKPPSPAMYFQNGKHITKAELDLSLHKPNGRKYYLPQQEAPQPGTPAWVSLNTQENLSQKVRCHLLDKGQTFYFHIDFDNLSNAELCLLQKALTPGEAFRHRLGLGKPLGLGSVTVKVCGLFLIDRAKRYGSEDWDTQSRYAWVDPSAWIGQEAVALSNLYPTEAAALGQSLEKPLLDEDLSYIDQATLNILHALGDPPAYHPVRYPFEGDNPNIETEGFKWFVSNDKKRGDQRQGLAVLAEGEKLRPIT